MNYKAPRGTHDIFGTNVAKMNLLEQRARVIFKKYGFEEVRTPIFEAASLFMRSVGQITDIVEKEMYIFEDKKGRELALRPEGTTSVVRAFVEHRFDVIMPAAKFFYMGEMFRYERPQAGRYRQFRQIGVEFFGVSSPVADAEIILLACDLLSSVGINKINVRLNSLGCQNCRPTFREELIKYLTSIEGLCEDCFKRLKKNPFRVLDCKIDLHKFTYIPEMSNYFCNRCRYDFDLLKSLLDSVGCDYEIDNKLVRGLDYYTKTVFEICCSDYLSFNTAFTGSEGFVGSHFAVDISHPIVLAAGGRYDNLVEELGGSSTPAVGFAFGAERVLIVAQGNLMLSNRLKELVELLFEMQKNSMPLTEKEIDNLFKRVLIDVQKKSSFDKFGYNNVRNCNYNEIAEQNSTLFNKLKEVLMIVQDSMLLNKEEIDDLFKTILNCLVGSSLNKFVDQNSMFFNKFKETLRKVLIATQDSAIFNSFQKEEVYIAIADQKLFKEAFSFAVRIRRDGLKNNKNVSVFGPIDGKSLTWQLNFADKIGVCKMIIFAKTEFKEGKVLIKNMKDKAQMEVFMNEL
ncbi:MAG: histidine--tRNA ligase [Endomicrobium sp.]|jgi:histidyl-tRNA synthetase|nr:histidine--tRNA ligase [Endomicrobium sp.]